VQRTTLRRGHSGARDQTARIYGCQACVVAGYVNPRRLYIELNYTLTDGQPFRSGSAPRSPKRSQRTTP